MNFRKFSSQAGQASRLLLVLAVVVLVAVIITYLILKMAEKPAQPIAPISTNTVPTPIYEQTLGSIRFVFESALDKGMVLRASDIPTTSSNNSSQKDIAVDNPGAKFIEVTIAAQNIGTEKTTQGAWTMQNIIDSKGRNYTPFEGSGVSAWLPSPDLCGAVLEPAFDPTPCTKIYEVSKESTGLKVKVATGKNNSSGNLSQSFLIDLIVK